MATTPIEPPSTGQLRRNVGLTKASVTRQINNLHSVLNDYGFSFSDSNYSFTTLSNEDIPIIYLDVTANHNSILRQYSRLDKYYTEWLALRTTYSAEETVYQQYIQKYGDYTTVIAQAVETLEKLDNFLHLLENEATSRAIVLIKDPVTPGSPGEEQELLQNATFTTDTNNIQSGNSGFIPTTTTMNQLLGNPFPAFTTSPHAAILNMRTYSLPVSDPNSRITPKIDSVPGPTRPATITSPSGAIIQTATPATTANGYGIQHGNLQMANIPYYNVPQGAYGSSNQYAGMPRGQMGTVYGQPVEQAFNFVDASLLTKLELPTFNGNILEFPEFWSRFMTLVGSKPHLDGATKLTLLKSSLKGRAASTLDGLPLTASNYEIAVEILRTHFDNPAQLRHIIYTKLAELPTCDEQGKQLAAIYCKMLSLVRQYSCCADDSREYGLAALLQNKLPKFVRSRIYDRNPTNKNLTPTELLQILTDIVRKEQSLSHTSKPEPTSTTEVFHVQHKGKEKPNKKHKDHERRNSPTPKKRLCQLCDSPEHRARRCTKYTTVDQKRKVAKERKLCFLCLRNDHAVSECRSTFLCEDCNGGRHHVALCMKQRSESHQSTPANNDRRREPSQRNSQSTRRTNQQTVHFATNDTTTEYEDDLPNSITSVHTVTEQPTRGAPERERSSYQDSTIEGKCEFDQPTPKNLGKPTALMCIEVSLFNPEDPTKQTRTRAFFDSGASKSYITKDLAQELKLSLIEEEPLSVNTFGRDDTTVVMSSIHSIGLHTTDGSEPVIMDIRAVPKLTSRLQMIIVRPDESEETSGQQQLSTEKIWDKPHLLIGIDQFWNLILSNNFHFKHLPSGHRLLHTRLGYVIANKKLEMKPCYQISLSNRDDEISLSHPGKHPPLEELVEKFWHLETLGILDCPFTSDDDKCLQLFNQTVEFSEEEGRYRVSLPFKISPTEIPNNRKLALQRSISNWNFLSRNPEHLLKYHAIFEEQLKLGIIEIIPESAFLNQLCHYLAHFGVVTEAKKTTKIRAVFDGSAKTKGNYSLNEALFRGPVLLPNLAGILIRIRLATILLTGDLEKAFLMVSLHDKSRDFTRFFWVKDPLKSLTADNLVEFKFCRVPFGLVPSPFLLEATIHFHLVRTGTTLATALLENIYVDNVFLDTESVEHGKKLYFESKKIFKDAGMNLREFMSSDPTLNHFLEAQEKTLVDEVTKILGISWNTKKDTLTIALPPIPKYAVWTKRKFLKETASIYDPTGMVLPATLPLKAFLQSLWKINIGWDEALPEELQNTWIRQMESRTVTEIEMPRRFSHQRDGTEVYSLHVFCDASGIAYAAVGYLCIHKESGTTTHLLMAKSRLSPISGNLTIPRLELQGLVIGAKLLVYLRTELKVTISKEYLWSDSRAALMWIKAGRDLPVFVKNRVKTINDLCPTTIIRHVPGELNPADVASRGCNITELLNLKLWSNGPGYISQSENHFPEDKSITTTLEDDSMDAEIGTSMETVCTVTEPSGTTINVSRFNSWIKLVNVMTLLFTFIFRTRRKGKIPQPADVNHRQYYEAQQEYPPTPDQIRQLRLFCPTETSLWQCQSRLMNSDLPNYTKNPIYLPRESRITHLLILDHHLQNSHGGVNQTLTDLRQQFWIPKGRVTVKKVILNDCYYCKRQLAKPYSLPPFPQLPAERIQRPLYAFEAVGLDYIGPFFYRNVEDALSKKYWICFFTCLSTRAAHASVVTSLSAKSFLHALRRFVATNGCPKFITSDNAPAFKAVSKCYQALDVKPAEIGALIDYCSQFHIKFKFIPSHSPWQGGCYERILGIFKKSYQASVRNTILPLEEVETLVMETTAITNTRPLTYLLSSEMECLPLRPIDFLRPYAKTGSPRFETDNDKEWSPRETSQLELAELWTQMNTMLDNFWTRYYNEYLTDMMSRYKNEHPQSRSKHLESPKHGDYVLIKNEMLPRGQWKVGQVVGSQDNYLRSVEIRTASRKIASRPLNLICKFEIAPSTTEKTGDPTPLQPVQSDSNPESKNTHGMTTRSKTKLLTTIAMLMCCFGLASSENLQCNNELIADKIIHVDNCMSSGTVIALTREKKFCWQQITCPFGALRKPKTPNSKLCSTECPCSSWTNLCSYYDGPLKNQSTYKRINSEHVLYLPPNVCSFEPTSVCDDKKNIGPFNQLELYDGSIVVVRELHVNVKTFGSSTEQMCFNSAGNRVDNPPYFSGNDEFCNIRSCTKNANIFCTFYNPIATYSDPNGKMDALPVKAWGQALKTYYSHKLIIERENLKKTNQVSCTTVGIFLESYTEEPTFVEARLSSTCITLHSHQLENHMIFPTSMVTFDYIVKVKVWNQGELTFNEEISCSGKPICEVLNCFVCREYIYNSRCWKPIHLASLFIILLISTLVLKVLRGILRILRCFRNCVFYVGTYCYSKTIGKLWKKSAQTEPSLQNNLPRYTRRRPVRKTLTMVMILLSIVSEGFPCSDVISSTSQHQHCISNNETEECVFEETTMLTLAPMNQELCFKMSNLEKHPMGYISLKVSGIYYKCNKRIEFYTRNHEILSESSHRCYSKGSCASGCPKLKYSDPIPELSNRANRSPGFSFCKTSCGCITCHGCGWCDPSCLLYRYYAVPTSQDMFTIYNCPTWDLHVEGELSLVTEDSHMATKFLLRPASTYVHNKIKISLLSATTPNFPILSSTFLTNGKTTSTIKPSSSGQFIAGTPSQLQCPTLANAKDFKCSFSQGGCSNFEYQINCNCPIGNVSQFLQKNTLPLQTKDLIIYSEKGELLAKTVQGSAIQVQLTISNMKLINKMTKNRCSVETGTLMGCYSCTMGAKVSIACTSSNSEELASLQCGSHQQMVMCSPKGHLNAITFHFDESAINQNCTLLCSGGSTQIKMEGTLDYVNDGLSMEQGQGSNQERIPEEENDSLIGSFLTGGAHPWKKGESIRSEELYGFAIMTKRQVFFDNSSNFHAFSAEDTLKIIGKL